MKIIVDTNIVFSALLNSSGKIGKILTHSKNHFQFYSCHFLKTELLKHRKKLLQLTRLSENELDELEQIVTSKINFINEELIPLKHIIAAEELVRDIDMNDILFVALAKHLKAKLWTGDKVLMTGLEKRKFRNCISTSRFSDLLDSLEK